MKTSQTVTLNRPIEDIWQIVAENFDAAYLWMPAVTESYAINKGQGNNGAPMLGRICHFSDKSDGPYARETITEFKPKEKSISFEVVPMNLPAILPVKKNLLQIKLKDLGQNKTQLTWISKPELKWFAYPFYPLLKLIIPKAFSPFLKGLKDYAEGPSTLVARNV